jgi:peroxiredoxin
VLSNPQVSAAVAPDFNLKDVNGGGVKLGDLKDKVVLVNFWAHSVKAARWRFRESWNFRKSMRIRDSLSSVFQWMMTAGNRKSLGSKRKCELS